MKRLTFVIAALIATLPCLAQKPAGRMSRKELQKENITLARQVDSLRLLLEECREMLQEEKEIADDIIDMYNAPQDDSSAYSPQTTDSLLNLWYVHRLNNSLDEGIYNMDSVHFTSNVPDSVLVDRIKRMNAYVTVPYNEKVRDYMILYSEKMPTKMQHMLGLAQYYMPIFEETLSRYDMPQELKYMAIIESALNPVAVSRVGAKGMWQFMYNTARSYGLKINSFVDERYDPVKSADAAARYMRDAYRIFGDWNLAISSYNCGSGNVLKAIKRSGSNKFWDIYEYLPRETRGYVPAFVGAMYAFNYFKEYGMTPSQVSLPSHADTIHVRKMLHFSQVSDVVGIPLQTLRDMNPQYLHDIVPGEEGYVLKIPSSYTSAFVEREDSVYAYKADELFNPTVMQNLKESGTVDSERIVYKVKSGDYLGRIASRYGVSVNKIKEWNHLRNNNLRVGQRLVIYKGGHAPAKASQSTSASSSAKTSDSGSVYTVKSGDTLYEIAKKYPGVSAQDIMKHNGMKSASIKPGMKLKIPSAK